MSDLISRQAAIEAMQKLEAEDIDMYGVSIPEGFDGERAVEALRELPSAEPEIIRCRDCKYYREYGYVNGKPKFLPRCTFSSIYVNADDFCSRAERRTDEQTD